MKRFIFSVLTVAVFFLGVGALVDRSGAASKSDERALELIRKARLAIGGDVAINSVQSLTIVGRTTKTIVVDGATRTEAGETEIAMQLPDKMMKMVKIGSSGGTAEGHRMINRTVDVIATGEPKDKMKVTIDANGTDGKAVARRVMVRKDDGTVVELTGDEAAKWVSENPVPAGAHVFTVKKNADGTITPGKEDVIVLRKSEGGDATFTTTDGKTIALKDKTYTVQSKDGANHEVVIVRKADGGEATFTAKDGNTVKLKEHDFAFHPAAAGSGVKSNEMLRTTLSLLLSAPQGMDVTYTFAGELNLDGTACNVVKAEFAGSTYKLFLDRSSNLPVAISYRGMPAPQVIKLDKVPAEGGKQDVVFARSIAGSKDLADIQVKFSDFRNVGGVLLPHRWAQSIGGKDDEIFDVTNYEINPANITERFQNQKVMVRTSKPDSK